MAGREDHVDVEARELQLLAALDRLLGIPGLERAEARPRDEAVDVGEHHLLDLGNPDLRAGRLRDRSHGSDVVEVRVRQQDRLEVEAELLDRAEQPRRLLAGVDDHGLARAVPAEQEAVLGHRADGEHPDVHHCWSFFAWRRRYMNRSVK